MGGWTPSLPGLPLGALSLPQSHLAEHGRQGQSREAADGAGLCRTGQWWAEHHRRRALKSLAGSPQAPGLDWLCLQGAGLHEAQREQLLWGQELNRNQRLCSAGDQGARPRPARTGASLRPQVPSRKREGPALGRNPLPRIRAPPGPRVE